MSNIKELREKHSKLIKHDFFVKEQINVHTKVSLNFAIEQLKRIQTLSAALVISELKKQLSEL